MSETGNGADPRTARSSRQTPQARPGYPARAALPALPVPQAPFTPPARVTPPTRRGVLAAGAGAGAAALLGAAGTATRAQAAQAVPAPVPGTPADLAPYASYWFPDSLPQGAPGPGITWRSLKQWSPESDPDLAHNTATVPLAPRFTPVPVNPGARAGQARISSLVSFGPTAQNPPRAPRPPTTTRSRTGRTSTSWCSGAAPPARESCSPRTRP